MKTSLQFDVLCEGVIASHHGRDPSFANRARFWVDYFGDRDITTMVTDDIEDGITELMRRGKLKPETQKIDGKIVSKVIATGQPLSPSTVNRYVSVLGTVFKDLKRMRLLPRGYINPMRGVGRQSEGESRTVTVTVDDVKRLVACCRLSRNHKLAAMVAMGCTTGWRLGNLQSLCWGDLDLANKTADTSLTKNGTPHRAVLLDWVVKELKAIMPEKVDPNEAVFDKRNFRRAWEMALKRADLPLEWTFHHCRHIAASMLAQSGASVPVIMSCLNHKSPNMALRYSHLNVATLRENLGRAWS